MSKLVRPGRSWKTVLGSMALAIAVVMPASLTAFAAEETDQAEAEMKVQFQADYRRLLDDAARTRRNLAIARENYSQSRQNRYPRGPERHEIQLDVEESVLEVAKVESEVEQFRTEARRQGALPGWLAEVEAEPRRGAEPAAPAQENRSDQEGRNPLYLETE